MAFTPRRHAFLRHVIAMPAILALIRRHYYVFIAIISRHADVFFSFSFHIISLPLILLLRYYAFFCSRVTLLLLPCFSFFAFSLFFAASAAS